MIALSDPAAALLSFAVVAVVVAAAMEVRDRWSRDRDEPVPGEDVISHVSVVPARDWGAEVRAAHRVQQDACIASGDHIAIYDQNDERGAA